MKHSKLSTLFNSLHETNANLSGDMVNITEVMALQLSGGDDPVGTFNDTGCSNNTCYNNSCATSQTNNNTNCTNTGCTGAGNTTCFNSSCRT